MWSLKGDEMLLIFKVIMRLVALAMIWAVISKHYGDFEGWTAAIVLYALLPEHKESL